MAQLGLNYNLTSNKGASVFFLANFKDFSVLDSTSLLLVYNHNGYLFKLPIVLSDDPDNGPSLAMTAGIAVAGNALVYAGYKWLKSRKAKTVGREQKTAFARYQSNTERANTYLHESQIFIDRSVNIEVKNRGLIIVEAYFGLAEHIYQIEAGLLRFRIPQNVEEYSRC